MIEIASLSKLVVKFNCQKEINYSEKRSKTKVYYEKQLHLYFSILCVFSVPKLLIFAIRISAKL